MFQNGVWGRNCAAPHDLVNTYVRVCPRASGSAVQRYVLKSYVDALVLSAHGGNASKAAQVTAKGLADKAVKKEEERKLQVRSSISVHVADFYHDVM